MSDLKEQIEYLKKNIKHSMDTFTMATSERVGMIDLYKDDNDDYIVSPILGEPEYKTEKP